MNSSRTLPIAFLLTCAIFAGCSKKEEPAAVAGAPASQNAKEITVYMYSEYIDPEIPASFEKQTGTKVRIDLYEATEEMEAKLKAGGTAQYDVVVMTDHAIPVFAKQGLIQPLDMQKIPNRANLSPRFQNPPFDPDNKHSVAYQWGTMGLMYRKDQAAGLEPTWAALFDPARQPSTFLLIDSMRDMMAAALKYKGYSINTRKVEELKEAGELILAAKKSTKCLGFEGGVGGKNKVVAGSAALAVAYNGDAIRGLEEEPNAAFAVPREGTLIWVDAMVIPSQAPHPVEAHAFINFILDPEIGAKLSDFNRYATPNAKSEALVNSDDRKNPAIYPTDEEIAKMEYLEDVGEDTRLYDEIWTSVKSR